MSLAVLRSRALAGMEAHEVVVEVLGDGRVDVPYVRFSPALQVRTLVMRKPSTGTPVVTKRNAIFLFCLLYTSPSPRD